MVGAKWGIEWRYCGRGREKHLGKGIPAVRMNAPQERECLKAEIVQDL